MKDIKIGKYRHFKRKEYEVLSFAILKNEFAFIVANKGCIFNK